MNLTLPLTATEEANILVRAQAEGVTPEVLVRRALEPLIAASPESPTETKKSSRHIAELIAERMQALPPEVFDRLPKDGASEHDHYLYGSPKRHQ
ncbi:conserved hypothetical protein [Candidatus Sulfopaludibacter sp. SbA4]|nr:conserved hypothetical protein [Candidatus Sulfopaludibacter sp. SbA4]